MKLSSTTNAHGELYSGSAYGYYLCCDFTGTHTCSSSNTILILSSSSNAHAEIPSSTSYPTDVCFGTLSCTATTGSSCPTSYPIAMISLSSTTNAHIAQFSTYSNKICCAANLASSCGNGEIDVGEACDDGNLINGDGCSTTCTIESTFECSGEPSDCNKICGNGVINSGEGCDNGASNTNTCTAPYGSSCSYCSSSTCQTVTLAGSSCGDGTCNTAYETCSSCSADCGCGTGYTCYSGVCELNCQLGSASWNTTSIIEGSPIKLTLSGTSCAGRKIIFEIYEKDGFLNADDALTSYGYSNPPFVYFPSTGTTAFTTWTTVMVDDTDGGQSNPPEYYFTATAVTSSGQSLSSVTSSQSAVTDPLLLTVNEDPYCGDGTIQSSNSETCDNGANNANTCTAPYGSSCSYCSSSTCQMVTIVGPSCGDGIIQVSNGETCDGTTLGGATCQSGYTGTPRCNANCTLNRNSTYCIPPCLISSAVWSTGSVEEETVVGLNVRTTNCNNGKIASFVIKEDDTVGDDDVTTNPVNVVINSNIANGSWKSEWLEEGWPETDPPEYYFTVTVDGNSLQSSAPELTVTESVQCVGISYCSGYSTRTSCEADKCNTGEASAPSNICTGKFNPETGCYDYVDCGCAWNAGSNECESSWNSEVSCGVCGNTINDYGEECDDGNTVSGDGCSSSCLYENEIDPPCKIGLTLCSDNTCSLNCEDTDTEVADCNYDGVCDSDEGCTCSDCNSEEDTCQEGLLCNIIDAACCSSTSDNVCNIYCSYIDPDCSGICGNGFEETGEQCDLGIKNEIAGSGCTEECKYKRITAPCPEGTALCSDGTCSLNCFSTGKGTTCDHDNTCDSGEGCACSDCDLKADTCVTGLACSTVDQACCDKVSDDYCNVYCSYVDPDCTAVTLNKDLFTVGKCSYTESGEDTCEDDGILVRSLSANWTWNANNTFTSNPDGEDYWETATGVFRYDPLDFSGIRNSEKCANIEDTLVCPASVEVPFELGLYGAISVTIIIALVYIFYFLKEKKKYNKKSKRK